MERILKNISDLSDYSKVSQDLTLKSDIQKAHLNLSTILALKKVRSYEIEFFNKYGSNGIMKAVFEDLLDSPPSKTWGILGKEVICLLQYWLDSLRNYLLKDSLNWWIFLKTLLRFIKMVRQKHNSLSNMLVEETAECLLDIATNNKVDMLQKYEIISCFNLYCAEASREVRVVMKMKLEEYLTKLSSVMASCGHFPTQHCILEALLRWTIGRQDLIVRRRAAEKWLPKNQYTEEARNMFLERKWADFFQDARDFLNMHNSATAVVASFICKKLTIGKVIVVSGSERKEVWLDVNTSTKCLTLLLDPRFLQMLTADTDSCYETLTIPDFNVRAVQVLRNTVEAKITLSTIEQLELRPSMVKINSDEGDDVIITVSGDGFDKLNAALRNVFGEEKCKEEEFSLPAEVNTRRRAGFMVRQRYDPLRSPSTASTSSLAQLPEKLAALPRYRFDKEPVSVCAHPELSNVTELTEPESSHNTTTSTFKLRPCGVFSRTFKKVPEEKERRSQSDSEIRKPGSKAKCISPALHDENSISCLLVATIGSEESIINDTLERLPIEKRTTDNIVDLLVQEALQSKTKDKDKNQDSGIIIGDKKTQEFQEANSDVVENTPYIDNYLRPSTSKDLDRKETNIAANNKSTSSDESNTEEINEIIETHVNYVSTRNKKTVKRIEDNDFNDNIFDGQSIENFFAQHYSENPAGEIIISPTLAKKINETSSNSSISEFDENILQVYENEDVILPLYNEEDVLNCLNSLINKVCEDLQKCSEYLHSDSQKPVIENLGNDNISVEGVNQNNIDAKVNNKVRDKIMNKKKTPKKKQPVKRKSIKLKYVITPKYERSNKVRTITKTNKLEPETKMSTINEDENEIIETELQPALPSPTKKKRDSSSNRTTTDSDTPLGRRKRKLYSPKEDDVEMGSEIKIPKVTIPETCEEVVPQTPSAKVTSYVTTSEEKDTNMKDVSKALATPYKDIEKERKKIRNPRNRKAKAKDIQLSPRTLKKNEVFDSLKEKIESNESIMFAEKSKDVGVYNFTTDSEDEDFKKKTVEIQKRTSTTTIASFDSTTSTKRGRKVNKVNYKEKKSDSAAEDNIVQKPRRKRSKRQNSKTNKSKIVESVKKELEDEKMREAQVEVLNTSLVIEKSIQETEKKDTEPIINVIPEMETIVDDDNKSELSKNVPVKSSKRIRDTHRILSIKKEKGNKKNAKLTIDEGSVSPLPGLVVETVEKTNNIIDADGSITPNMIKKFKKIYKDGPELDHNVTNTTQNMLSDVDRINYSPEMNVTEEVNRGLADIIEIEDVTNFTCDSNKENVPIKRKTKRDNNTNKKIHKFKDDDTTTEKLNQIEVINISIESLNANDIDKISIDTGGKSPITAHGDSNENPPNQQLLNETVIPRNLEIEDLDQSMANYFLKLTKEMNESADKFYSCDERRSDSSKIVEYKSPEECIERSENKSPVVSITRLSSGEIHRWLPSPRSSDSEDEIPIEKVKESNKSVPIKESNKNKRKILKRDVNKTVETVKGISTEGDDSTVITVVTAETTQKNKKKKSVKKNIVARNTDKDETPRGKGQEIEQIKEWEFNNLEVSSSPIKQKTQPRKTTISPIKLSFDDPTCAELQSNKSNSENVVDLTKMTSNSRSDAKTQKSAKLESSQRYYLRRSLRKNISSPDSKPSSSVKLVKNTKTEEFDHNVVTQKVNETKRRIFGEETTFASVQSISSVNEWFKTIPSSQKVDSAALSCYEEAIDTVVEKLDTTLAEIHQSTSKKFIILFVDAQKQLQQQRLERHTLYKETAKDIMKNMARVIEDKFSDLERKSQEMEQQFMENLKKLSCNMVREDNKQKRAMVVLLKEDIQAVVDHLEKTNRNK